MENNKVICSGETFEFSEVTATNYTTLKWTSNSSVGTFDNNTFLNPIYTPNADDKTVILRLTATNSNGTADYKDFSLTIKPKVLAIIIEK